MGASDIGYRIARSYDVALTDTRPALVPLTFSGSLIDEIAPLSGTSVQGAVTAGKARFDDGLLFTHRGLSGPSVLQASSYWREGEQITLDLAANTDIAPALASQRQQAGRIALTTAVAVHLPERVARASVARSGLTGNLADQSNAALDHLAAVIHRWQVTPQGSEGYRTAEVTLGGVDTDAIDPRSFEARAQPGLHFIGEVLDVTGWLGGYNFQWAWSSGWCCGQAV
jgi:predicted Rossmann fold flavoprotein